MYRKLRVPHSSSRSTCAFRVRTAQSPSSTVPCEFAGEGMCAESADDLGPVRLIATAARATRRTNRFTVDVPPCGVPSPGRTKCEGPILITVLPANADQRFVATSCVHSAILAPPARNAICPRWMSCGRLESTINRQNSQTRVWSLGANTDLVKRPRTTLSDHWRDYPLAELNAITVDRAAQRHQPLPRRG